MRRNLLLKTMFSFILVTTFGLGLATLSAPPIDAKLPQLLCPTTKCVSTVGYTYDGYCNHSVDGCLFACKRWVNYQTGHVCTTDCIPY